MRAVLTIAGSDSGGGAGIQADLKTFEAHKIFGTSVITALTAQNSVGVQSAAAVAPAMVRAQIRSVLDDFPVKAIKTGMLYDAETIETVAEELLLRGIPIVVDPVMVSTSGDDLLQKDALEALKRLLLPAASIITPNLAEAALLADMPVRTKDDMLLAAQRIAEANPEAWILIKGGHLEGNMATDLLFRIEEAPIWLEEEAVPTEDTHGTGCTLSAAIAANLASEYDMIDAVKMAKSYVTGAIQHAWKNLGKGPGSLRHHFQCLQEKP
jgi:hydroxymethylpyrimidine kinase/phosphomethylpyrimidine kinase